MLISLLAIFLIEVLVLSVLVHTNHGFWGLTSVLVTFGAYALVAGIPAAVALWYGVIANPLLTVYCILGYLVIGVLWSFFKYYSFVRERKRDGYTYEMLQNANNKGRVITWMAYWPFSAIAHLVGDGLYKLFVWIYDQVSGVYDRILKSVYSA